MMTGAIDGNVGDGRPLARRDIMRGGLHAAVLGAILGATAARPLAATAAGSRGGEIFAFRSPEGADLVFALTVPADNLAPPGAGTQVVCIHAGSESWTVSDAEQLSTAAAGSRLFVGLTAKRTQSGAEPHRLTVVAAPLTSFTSSKLPVWAELLGRNGSRVRVGNPIASALLDQNPAMARVFHGVHPDRDRAVLTTSLVDLISVLRAKAGSAFPRLHGEYLADRLLPNVLQFDSGKPVGFTFAGQNGRRPSDRVASVVDAMLSGVVAQGSGTEGVFEASNMFPYFLPLYA